MKKKTKRSDTGRLNGLQELLTKRGGPFVMCFEPTFVGKKGSHRGMVRRAIDNFLDNELKK